MDISSSTQQKNWTPEEELAFIRKVIQDSRQSMVENGKPYIAWGLVVALMMFATYIEALTGGNGSITGWLWLIFGTAIGIASIRWARQEGPKQQSRPFADRLGGAIWGACGGTLGLVIVLVNVGRAIDPELYIDPLLVCPLVSLILGIAYFLSGIVNDLKWLRNIGFAWWIGGSAMFFIHSIHVLAVYGMMLLVFQVIPGILLYRNHKHATLSAFSH